MIGFCKLVWAVLLLSLSGLTYAVGEVDERVNINTADSATLARVLVGVGESRAEAIVRYREQHGEFVDAYELANVKGIGERTVERNEAKIVLDD
ncbi:MAG: ComEA family DNA-binding protein [Pseudomonadales bacterium]